MITDSLVFKLMKLFLDCQNDQNIMTLSDLKSKLYKRNNNQTPVFVLYFNRDLAYCMVYEIMNLYKNYTNKPKSKVYRWFNKTIL